MTTSAAKKFWTDEELLALPKDGIKREIINGELVESGTPDGTPPARKYWTDEELLAMPKDGYKREIVCGELVMSPAGFDHGNLINRLVVAIGVVVYARQLGELSDGQTGFRLSNGDLFSPDISFITAARVAGHKQRQRASTFFQGAPDLAIEVLSPSDTIGTLENKLAQLFNDGTQLAWVFHPGAQTVHVYHSPVPDKILTRSDTLDGEGLIPGFSLPLAQIFV